MRGMEPNNGTFPVENKQRLPKMVYSFLVLHFGENFMKLNQKYQSYRCMKNCIYGKSCISSYSKNNYFSPCTN